MSDLEQTKALERAIEALLRCVRWIEFTVEEPGDDEPDDLAAWKNAKRIARPGEYPENMP
jgi:hypothetical protein